MAYELQWGSDKPGHIVFLIDLSESMENKIDYVIDALQKTCQSIVTHCVSGREVKNRISVTILGYNYQIKTLLKAESARDLAIKVANARKAGKPLFDKQNEAKPEYQTRMQAAFEAAQVDIEQWIAKQKAAGAPIPAPIVINITDGEPWEGKAYNQKDVYSNTLKAARNLMNISTPDGNVRLFNIHHDPSSKSETLRFPTTKPNSEHLQFLYDASSGMSEDMLKTAHSYGFITADMNSRCMISNEHEVSKLASFIEWGSSK